MNALLEQFLTEARDFLQNINEKLLELERAPGDGAHMVELFRLVHTLKGNTGLFDFPEMTRVLHAAEDLMDAVRHGQVAYTQTLADQLLAAMDFVSMLCEDIEANGGNDASYAGNAAQLATALRAMLASADAPQTQNPALTSADATKASGPDLHALAAIPADIRLEAWRRTLDGDALSWLAYRPQEDCFFQGDDPLHTARQTPGVLWGRIIAPATWPARQEIDAYRCVLAFELLTNAPREELAEHYRYVADQVQITHLDPEQLAATLGSDLAQQSPATPVGADLEPLQAILVAQREILQLDGTPAWGAGRTQAAAQTLIQCCRARGDAAGIAAVEAALAQSLSSGTNTPLLAWLAQHPVLQGLQAQTQPPARPEVAAPAGEEVPRFMRRTEEAPATAKNLKVDQARIDQLMNLIGEMVVAKNALPYLAQRAEEQYGVRELAREIKAQYAVINRIVEEMQGAIMQVRMMPVSFVFQRFPRLVRDISRRLGKEVELVLEGEETEADKNIIESLTDPLIHIVRNSLDHGLETPEVRRAAGKPGAGLLTIRAAQEGDQVLIEINDDGKGMDPAVIKRKAYEKGLIDEAALERLSDREAIQLVFAPGFSTAEVVSDLSGRGVGMDVVRTAVEKVHGSITLDSVAGQGTNIRIALPLSMAVTQVMVVESDHQIFGVPMDHVVETVRIPTDAIHVIKRSKTAVLRGSIVPLKTLNELLGLPAEPRANAHDELAVLVVRVGHASVGLIVDDFRETVDVIQKPLDGVLSGLSAYSGSALMGDGSVLMVLNVKEIV